MADNRADKSGFAREAKDRIDAKYNVDLARQVLGWIADVSGEPLDTSGERESFVAQLRDGRVLCRLD